jgi:hypothetical protein
MTQQLTRLSIDEVQFGTSRARIILVLGRRPLLVVSVQPVVNVAISLWADKNNMGHKILIGFRVPTTLI